jgi:hypothetical protein
VGARVLDDATEKQLLLPTPLSRRLPDVISDI